MKTNRNTMIDAKVHFIGDGSCRGTNFYWQERMGRWVVIDLENAKVSFHEGLALVRCAGDADEGLNQECLGCDLEGEGLWLVDVESLEEFDDGYVHDIAGVERKGW